MPYYPQSATGLGYISYPAGPTAVASTITAGGSNNTKGSYVEFVSSSPFAANYIFINVITASGTGTFLLDIATGGSGSETVIIPNILVDRQTSASGHTGAGFWAIPISIPAGTRISARCQSSVLSQTLEVAITIVAAGGNAGPTTWTNNGALTASSLGTQVDPGATINTKGAYSQMVASTAAVTQIMMIQFSNRGLNVAASARWCVDIATGAAASEVVLVPDLRFTSSDAVAIPSTPRSFTLLTYIPAGTRIAVRASCSSNDASYRIFDCAIMTATAPNDVTSGSFSRIFSGF